MNAENANVGDLTAYLVGDLSLRHESREAASMATLVLQHVLGLSRMDLILEANRAVQPNQVEDVQQILGDLRAGRPVQYVLGSTVFLDLVLEVDESVLIPRPETEELVAWTISELEGEAPAVLDVGTGSGCIALGIKSKFPKARLFACDVSLDALAVATANGKRLGLDVDWFACDILEETPALPPLQVLVSNPPYIPSKDAADMEEHVVLHEPHQALFVGEDPLIFYRTLAEQGLLLLEVGGRLMLEVHERFMPEVRDVLEESGYTSEPRKDLQGKWRMVKAVRSDR